MTTKKIGSLVFALAALLLTGCNPAIGPEQDKTISTLTISGITAPATEAEPATSLDETEYTGTISWSPMINGTFTAYTVYTATITLTPKTGYTMTGLPANSFSVQGATSVSNSADSGVVTVVFLETSPKDVTSTNIGALKGVQGGTLSSGSLQFQVGSFLMGQNEITGAQYAAVMGISDPSCFSTLLDHPVERVSWYAAIVFCNRLSRSENLTPVYTIKGSTDPADWGAIPAYSDQDWNKVNADWSADGYRLPTEVEWEYAAKGGNSSHGFTYAGSDAIASVAWYNDNSLGKTHAAGGKAANELGLFDMSGNVWEWCWDVYGAQLSAPTNYDENTTAYQRVNRGGDVCESESACAVTSRSSCNDPSWIPISETKYVGIRVVRH